MVTRYNSFESVVTRRCVFIAVLYASTADVLSTKLSRIAWNENDKLQTSKGKPVYVRISITSPFSTGLQIWQTLQRKHGFHSEAFSSLGSRWKPIC